MIYCTAPSGCLFSVLAVFDFSFDFFQSHSSQVLGSFVQLLHLFGGRMEWILFLKSSSAAQSR